MTGNAALLAGLGVVAIGFGLLFAVLALVQPFTDPLWITGNLAAGIALLGAALFMSRDVLGKRLRSGGGRRAGKFGTSAVLGAALAILILGFLGFLAERHHKRFDVSEAGVNTLADQTLALLDGLEQDVTITAFFGELESPSLASALDAYRYESDRVSVRYVDPNDDPMLVETLGITPEELSRGVLHVALASGESRTISQFSSERFEPEITSALIKLVKSSDARIYFLTGHNERRIEAEPGGQGGFAATPDSFGRAAEALVDEAFAVEPLLLLNQAEVPGDATAVVVAGPTRPLLENEIGALRRYVEGGGGLLVAIDPRAQTNLYELLESWGVVLGDDVIVDRAMAVYDQATTPIAQQYDGEHPITAPMRAPTIFPMVRSVLLLPSVEDVYSLLAFTGPDSWAERDLDGWRETGRAEYDDRDLLGPVPIAAAGSPGAEQAGASGGRLVVFGDSDFATNQFLDTSQNRDLFLNAVNWLAGDEGQITIRPNVARFSDLQMSQADFVAIQSLSLLVLPEAIAVIGVLTWWLRRKAPGAS